MKSSEKKIIEILQDLKLNYGAVALKAEFEDEGASFEEVERFKSMAEELGFAFTLKIGGSGALNDIRKAKELNVEKLVAPMIESAYAVEKFVESVKLVYEDSSFPELFINIETITGVENIDSILCAKHSEYIKGVTLGRLDLSKSMGLEYSQIHSEEMFETVQNVSQKVSIKNKEFIVGGGVSEKSINFFEKLDNLQKFETRKIVFDFEQKQSLCAQAISKAIEFELMWLDYRQKNFCAIENIHKKRTVCLRKRFEELNCILTNN